jgi:protein involved in temperature-dependent protein secretion
VPFGQRLLLLDGEEVVPLLEVRDLQFAADGREASNAASS